MVAVFNLLMFTLLQLSEVKRDLMMGNEKAFEEQRLRNKFLRDKVTTLEQQVAALQQQIAADETQVCFTSRWCLDKAIIVFDVHFSLSVCQHIVVRIFIEWRILCLCVNASGVNIFKNKMDRYLIKAGYT